MEKDKFRPAVTVSSDQAILDFHGPLNENAKLPDVPKGVSSVVVRLHGVSQLNSLGVREWCAWIKKLEPPIKIHLEGCPFIFVKSFSLIRGALTANTTIGSMYLPVYSTVTKEERYALLERGTHFSDAGILSLADFKDSQGQVMQLDEIAKRYLGFLVDPAKPGT